MKTIKLQLYKFDELSDQAKEKAIQNYRNKDYDFHWSEEWIGTIEKALNHFDIKLKDYSIDWFNVDGCYTDIEFNQDDYYSDGIENLSYVRLWKYINNNYLKIWDKYSNKYVNVLESDYPFTGYCGDYDFLGPIKEFMKCPENITFKNLIENCIYQTIKAGCQDYNYQNSDEYIIEEMQANEYDFLENGEQY